MGTFRGEPEDGEDVNENIRKGEINSPQDFQQFSSWIVSTAELCKRNLHVTLNIRSYGPKGSVIIQAVLLRLYDPTKTLTEAFVLLDLPKFTHCFLIPYIATALIAEDRDCSYETAHQQMIISGDVGLALL